MNGTADRDSIFLAVGPLAAIILGIVLIPLREVTIASNLTFFFLALTIVVAEWGGRWPAVATALVSALSLDFFLTQPYLQLSIAQKHDIVAFVGLAACGLLAAALGSGRRDRRGELRRARVLGALVGEAVAELAVAGPMDARLGRVLHAAQSSLPLAKVSVRYLGDVLIASVPVSGTEVPVTVLRGSSLLAVDGPPDGSRSSALLPSGGGRLKLTSNGRAVGWLDVWGTGMPFERSEREALGDIADVIGALVATG